MNKYSSVIKLNLLMLIFLLVSACSHTPTSYNVPLVLNNKSRVLIPTQQNLKVLVSKKIENPQFFGGNNSFENINFQGIISWLQYRLLEVNILDCTLTKKIDVKIAVKKLYATGDSDTLVGTLVLKAEITAPDGKAIMRNYRGDCQVGFFTSSARTGLQSCLNSSLDSIIQRIKHDVCKLGSEN